MRLSIDDFPEFFAAVNNGARPYAWQTRLLDHISSTGVWPEEIVAPTGAGKSCAVEAHLFANALASLGCGQRVPRRLAMSVSRRAIVDQHEDRARRIAMLLHRPSDPVLVAVAAALQALRGGDNASQPTGEVGASPLMTVSLRGGVSPTREWLMDPSCCAVLAVTPDMWGSRVLFRGYGTSALARPREAGLLALDTVLVIDESHLSRQLEATGRRVAALVADEAGTIGVPGLQTVAMTATPTGEGERVGVTADDLASDPQLRQRLLAAKTLHFEQVPPWRASRPSAVHIQRLTELAGELSSTLPSNTTEAQTVGVVVNNVKTAIGVASRLRAEYGDDAVQCWVGRMRPLDLQDARRRTPGLFTIDGDRSIRFLVATQTVEVGVDLDLAGLVTELAPADALVQRIGRVNRRGIRLAADVIVVGPGRDQITDQAPYEAGDLIASLDWLEATISTGGDVSPWVLSNETAAERPSARLRRRVLTSLHRHEVELLAQTTTPLFAEPELNFYIRDSLVADVEPVGFVFRRPLPDDDAQAMALLKATPPSADEVFPASVRVARGIIARLFAEDKQARVFRWSKGDFAQLSAASVGPGDVIVLEPAAITVEGVITDDDVDAVEGHKIIWGDGVRRVLVAGHDDDELADFADVDPEDAAQVCQDVLGVPVQPIIGSPDASGTGPAWVVLKDPSVMASEPDLRQEWSPVNPVLLETHSLAVQARAQSLSERIGLQPALMRALAEAGLRHDWGKEDGRFQRSLGPGDGLRAKSDIHNRHLAKQLRAKSGLPARWRHEQLSVAMSHADDAPENGDLIARLIGVSHGHGRPFFPHGVTGLLGPDHATGPVAEAARELFGTGAGWSDVLESTHRQFGVWGCAYLEAVLRSADGMVSAEGS